MERRSQPFIIWTRQRTGGISLFSALCSVSQHPAAEIEPFDFGNVSDRQFSDVGKRLPPAKRDSRLREIADRGWLIKHCYENLSAEFNHALAEIFTRAGYRHIHLFRRDQVARLVSKGIAEREGTWGGHSWTRARYAAMLASGREFSLDIAALKRYHETSEARWASLEPLLPVLDVAMEDLFRDPQSPILARLAGFLGIRGSSVPKIAASLGQPHGTRKLWGLISNLPQLRAAIGGLA